VGIAKSNEFIYNQKAKEQTEEISVEVKGRYEQNDVQFQR
jgi:hypothetical protein